MSTSRICVLLFSLLWPAVQAFSAEPESFVLPKGTNVETGLARGHYRFWLPDKRVVSVKDYDQESGKAGDVGVFDKKGDVIVKGENARLTFSGTATREQASKLPASDHLEIGGVTLLLPATLVYQIKVEPPPVPPKGATAAPAPGQPAAAPKAP